MQELQSLGQRKDEASINAQSSISDLKSKLSVEEANRRNVESEYRVKEEGLKRYKGELKDNGRLERQVNSLHSRLETCRRDFRSISGEAREFKSFVDKLRTRLHLVTNLTETPRNSSRGRRMSVRKCGTPTL